MVLITGGSGYLGGRIAEYLIKSGVDVKIGSHRSIGGACQMDFSSDLSLMEACRGVSSVIHLAALNADACSDDPEAALLVNSLGTLKLLQAAEKSGVSKLIYFSTAHVYKSPLQGDISEGSLCSPSHHYSITHKVAEDYVLLANLNNNISTTVFRLTNAVGVPIRQDVNCWMLVANDLCKQVVTTRAMRINSSKWTKRDFIPISVICSIVEPVIRENLLSGEIVNMSSGVGLTLKDLSELIACRAEKILGFTPSIFFNDLSDEKNETSLQISNKKLIKLDLDIKFDLSEEIDQLLIYSRQWFA